MRAMDRTPRLTGELLDAPGAGGQRAGQWTIMEAPFALDLFFAAMMQGDIGWRVGMAICDNGY